MLDEKNQRLFVSDGDNNRILVWDIAPERLTETPEAMIVLGQMSFETKSKGSGPRGLNAPENIFYDDTRDRLFVSDTGNHRVVVFDARPERLKSGMAAFAVLGQPDFDGAEPGVARDRLARPNHLAYGSAYVEPAFLEGKQELELPHISDGGGVATEIVLINPTDDDIETTLSFVSSDGKARMSILR